MGIFGFGRKKEEPVAERRSDFQRDILELLGRDDIQSRHDICDAEYRKAISLLSDPSGEAYKHAIGIMLGLLDELEYGPAGLWLGEQAERGNDFARVASWYKQGADFGDGNAAKNYADMIMAGHVRNASQAVAKGYYVIAEDNGIAEAAFVLGEFARNENDRSEAILHYKKALELGYQPAQIRLEQMDHREPATASVFILSFHLSE